MYNHTLYFLYWVVNFVVFYLSSYFLEGSVVLGNWKFTPIEAAIYSSFWLVFFIWIVWDFLIARRVILKENFYVWIYFWAVNAVGVWLISKMAYFLGLGITKWYFAVIIAFFANMLQRLVFRIVTRRNLGV